MDAAWTVFLAAYPLVMMVLGYGLGYYVGRLEELYQARRARRLELHSASHSLGGESPHTAIDPSPGPTAPPGAATCQDATRPARPSSKASAAPSRARNEPSR